MATRIFSLDARRYGNDAGEAVTLTLEELIPDDGNEVVVLNQSSTDVTVLTDDPVTEHGIETAHVTNAGHDVSGFAYCRFAGGLTLFYPRTRIVAVADGE